MSEQLARDDLERLMKAGYTPRDYGGWPHWVRPSSGEVATIEELAAVLLGDDRGAFSWVPPRLVEAARLGLG
jgi:hypothetical protein